MRFELLLLLMFLILSCKSTEEIKNPYSAYDSKQYAVAVELLESEFNKQNNDEKKAELAYMLGKSFQNIGELKKSLTWYREAVKLNYGGSAFMEMAYGLKKLGEYDLAVQYLNEVAKRVSNRSIINQEIRKCLEAKNLLEMWSDSEVEIEKMNINSTSSEYSPHFLDKDHLIFTTDRLIEGEKIYKWTNRGFSEFYTYHLNNKSVQPYDGNLSTENNEGSVVFTKDKRTAYFCRCYADEGNHFCKVMRSDYKNNKWSEAIPAIPMDTEMNYRDPALIQNDSVLVYSCDDPSGYGGYDLYYSVFDGESWSYPDLMPPNINTEGNERFPTVNNDTLYFSSDFKVGFGGYDIFKTYLTSDLRWSTPQNIGAPYNSSFDDFSYIVNPYPRDFVAIEGYFVSDRNQESKDDIFYFIKRSDEKVDTTSSSVPVVVDDVDSSNVTIALQLVVIEDLYALENNPNSMKLGTKKVQDAAVIVRHNVEKIDLVTDQKGRALYEIQPGTDYKILVGKKGYLNTESEFYFTEKEINIREGLQTFRKEVKIERIFEDVEIVLDNIYYDFNESYIRDDAKPALMSLYKMMQNNPNVEIQLSSHTDCQGTDQYNMDLSQKRAESAVQFLIEQGISPDRIVAVGYGESQLSIECDCESCNDNEHQLNRRTTFKILKS